MAPSHGVANQQKLLMSFQEELPFNHILVSQSMVAHDLILRQAKARKSALD